MVVASVLISFFYLQLSSFPSTIFWRDCLFSIVKDNLASFVKDKLPIVAWVSLGGFCPVPLICRSVFLPVPSCPDYCSFVIQSEVREPDSSSSIFRFQDCFGSSRLFCVPMETVVFLFWLDAIFSLRLLLLPASPFSLSALFHASGTLTYFAFGHHYASFTSLSRGPVLSAASTFYPILLAV